LWHGISASTRRSYGSAPRSFVDFCRLRGLRAPFFPATAERVGPWIAQVADHLVRDTGSLSTKSLKRRITALRSHHTDLGIDTSGITSTRVERVIAGAHRYHGTRRREQPLPITLPILLRMLSHIQRHPSSYGGRVGHLAVMAAFSLMFACFMRMGEATYQAFDPRFDLSRSSVHLPSSLDEVPTITIPASKTDPWRAGVTVVIPVGGDACPVRLLRLYFAAAPATPSSPLFSFGSRPFSRATLARYLTSALNACGYAGTAYSGHSFRRGAATWASSIGMTPTEIKTLGRWNSDCFRLYVDAGPPTHAAAGRRLLNTPAHQSSLPADGVPQPGQVWRPSL
jgi:integrase